MTVTLTFDATLSRVAITATGLAAADLAKVERSTNNLTWTTVRGGGSWPCSAGAFSRTLYDYEFSPGVTNYYRVRGRQSVASTFVSAGTAASAANGSVTPGLPAGMTSGDLVLIFASTRNSGTGTVNTPASWTQVAVSGNAAVFGRIYDGVWTMPTVSFTNGAALEDTIAQSAAWRNVDLTPVSTNTLLNSSVQNIAYPALTPPQANCTVVVAGWKQDDYTSVATLAGMTEIQEASSVAGNDASQVWDYVIQTTATAIGAGSFTVTGGASAISRGLVLCFQKQIYLNEQTQTINPAQTTVWLKSLNRPYLNTSVIPDAQTGDFTRTSRNGVFPVAGRTLPVAVTDARSGRSFPLAVQTATTGDETDLDLLMLSGDVVLLQVPSGYPLLPAGYYSVGDVVESRRDGDPTSAARYWTLPLTEAASPTADVVPPAGTCQGILNAYATCAAVLAAFATCKDVLDFVGSPTDVIVP